MNQDTEHTCRLMHRTIPYLKASGGITDIVIDKKLSFEDKIILFNALKDEINGRILEMLSKSEESRKELEKQVSYYRQHPKLAKQWDNLELRNI